MDTPLPGSACPLLQPLLTSVLLYTLILVCGSGTRELVSSLIPVPAWLYTTLYATSPVAPALMLMPSPSVLPQLVRVLRRMVRCRGALAAPFCVCRRNTSSCPFENQESSISTLQATTELICTDPRAL